MRLAHDKKLNVEHEALGSDVNRLTSMFVEMCENNRDRRDYTRAEIRRAIREVAACFCDLPDVRGAGARSRSRTRIEQQIDEAVARARRSSGRTLIAGLFDFIGDVLTLRARGAAGDGVSAALPAVHVAGDGEGRGGHGVLLLQPDDRDERGGRIVRSATG